MDRPLVVAVIRKCVDNGAVVFSTHALTKHPVREGFTEQDALQTLRDGAVIEEYSGRDRFLISGEAPGIAPDPRYVGRYIHLVVRVEPGAEIEVPVMTMYRPLRSEWLDGYTRR